MRRFLAFGFCSSLTVVHAIIPRTTAASSRARFLSSAAAAFSGAVFTMAQPTECDAAIKPVGSGNPRYIEKNLEMKYGETPGT